MEKPAKERLEYLDSLRGLAALAVVFSHFFLAYDFPPAWYPFLVASPLHFFWDGFAAVSLFFVLSGYVLARKFLRATENPLRNIPAFFLARIVRIWLPFLAMLLLSAAFWALWPVRSGNFTVESSWLRGFWREELSLVWLAKQALLVVNFPGERLIPQDWTLTQELNLSFLLPFMVWMVLRSSVGLVLLVCAAIFWLKLPLLSLHFALGVLLAKHEAQVRAWLHPRWARALALAAGILFYTFRFSVPLYFPGIIPEQRIWYVTGFGSALLIAVALSDSFFQTWLKRKFLVWLGAISFALYLCHFALLVAWVPRFVLWAQDSLGVSISVAPYVVLPIYLALTLAFAHFFTRFVDDPCVRWSRGAYRRWQRREA